MFKNECNCSTTIEASCWKNCRECLERFLLNPYIKETINKTYIPTKDDFISLLHLSIYANKSYYGECTKLLILNGADPNIQTQIKKNTPLHICNSFTKTQLLLEYGADPFIKNYKGKLPKDEINSDSIKELLEEYEHRLLEMKTPE